MAAERQAQQRGLSAVLGKHAQPIKHSMRLPLVQGSGEHAVADLFAYVSPANETRFLQNAELRGVTVLLVGSTGSGKSSLANLMYTVVRRAAGGRAAPLPFEVFDDGQEGTMCVRCAEASPCFMLFDTRGTQGALDEYAEQLVQVVDGTLPPGSLMWREGDNEDDDAGFADVFSSGLDFGGGDAGTPAGATGASAAPLDASARVRRGDFLQVDCCVIVADALSADVHGERARFVSGSMAFVQRLRGIGMFPLLVLTHAREAGEPAGDENAAGRGSRLARARRNMVRLYDPWRDELRMSSEQLESAVYCVDNALRHASDAEWATRLAGARDAVVDLLLDCARAAADFREHVRECASRDAAQRPR